MKELSSLDLHYLSRELKALEGAKLEKVYQDNENFLFLFHKAGKLMLRIKLPGLMYLTEYKPSFPDTPPGFCMFLRKHLSGARVVQAGQKGFERIFEIVFEVRDGEQLARKRLILELFSKGNILVVDEAGKIKGLLSQQSWTTRILRPGSTYEYPPNPKDTPNIALEDFRQALNESKYDAPVKALAVELSLGGEYAEEAFKRAGVAKDTKELTEPQTKKLHEAVHSLFTTPHPQVLGERAYPIEMGGKDTVSFSHALDEVCTDRLTSSAQDKERKEKQTKQDKLRKIIEKQGERIELLEKSIDESQRRGELLYERYTEVKELLATLNEDRKRIGWEGIEAKYKDHPMVRKVDAAKGLVELEL